jgi:hypothetical protein
MPHLQLVVLLQLDLLNWLQVAAPRRPQSLRQADGSLPRPVIQLLHLRSELIQPARQYAKRHLNDACSKT